MSLQQTADTFEQWDVSLLNAGVSTVLKKSTVQHQSWIRWAWFGPCCLVFLTPCLYYFLFYFKRPLTLHIEFCVASLGHICILPLVHTSVSLPFSMPGHLFVYPAFPHPCFLVLLLTLSGGSFWFSSQHLRVSSVYVLSHSGAESQSQIKTHGCCFRCQLSERFAEWSIDPEVTAQARVFTGFQPVV